MPATGLGTSALTLSVWISTSGSSRSTRSPGFFSQRPIVPSETDSPSCGMRTTVLAIVLVRCQPPHGVHHVVGVGQDGLFEGGRVRDVGIGGGQAHDWPVELFECFFGDERRDFGADAAGFVVLVQD